MNEGIGELTLAVTREAGRLAGSAEAAAVLESIGVGDERAKTLGHANMFRLAAEVAEEQDRSPTALAARAEAEAERRRARLTAHRRPARPVTGALAVAVPVVTAASATAILTASLWNDGSAGIERATAVGLAAMTSLSLAAGFVLAMVRERAASRRWAALRPAIPGLAGAIIGGLGLWALVSAVALVAPDEVGIVGQYYALLSVLWLASGLVMAARRTAWVTVAFAAGAVAGFLLREVAHTSLVGAQRAGILVAAGVAVLAAWWPAGRTSGSSRRRPDRRVERARRADDGRTPLRERIHSTGPLVLFGVAFAGLVFVAQAATWHSQSRRHPWILALQPDVQAGWTWALVAVLGAVAMVAASARGFGGQLGLVADRTPLTAPGRMALEAQAARRRVMGRVVLWALFGAAVTLVAVVVLMAVSTSFAEVVSRNTALVFEIVGPGLVLVAWAAFDASILVAMRRPAAPAVAAVAGVAVAAVTAVVLARTAPDWSPAAGFDAGAVVCWALTSAGARRVLRTPDVALAARG